MKYFKPTSVTWWASVVPIVFGITGATEPLHGLTSIVTTVDALTGGAEPVMLINAGLVGIGLRAAL